MKPLRRIKAKSKITEHSYILHYATIAEAKQRNPAFIDFEYI